MQQPAKQEEATTNKSQLPTTEQPRAVEPIIDAGAALTTSYIELPTIGAPSLSDVILCNYAVGNCTPVSTGEAVSCTDSCKCEGCSGGGAQAPSTDCDGEGAGICIVAGIACAAMCSSLALLGLYLKQVGDSCNTERRTMATARTLLSLGTVAGVWLMLELLEGDKLKNSLLAIATPECFAGNNRIPDCEISSSINALATFGEQMVWAIVAFAAGNLTHALSKPLISMRGGRVAPMYERLSEEGRASPPPVDETTSLSGEGEPRQVRTYTAPGNRH